MATEARVPVLAAKGGSFLIEERSPDEVFTPEDFSEEQRMIGRTAEQFMEKEMVPRLPAILSLKYEATRELLRKAGELGLLGVEIPEATLQAFYEHGHAGKPMPTDGGDADTTLARHAEAGIDVPALAAKLQADAATAFVESWNALLALIDKQSAALRA